MEEVIYNIGKIKYLLIVLFGKTRKINRVVMVDIEDKEQIPIPTDLMISLGRSAVIITKPLKENSFERVPFIVKPWKSINLNNEEIPNSKAYIDCDNHVWVYFKAPDGDFITYDNNDGLLFHFEISYK